MPIELGEHPVAVLAEEIEAGNITAFVTVAGNPVLSCPDSDRLDAALKGLDFMVSVDCYLNETTRHADVILPPPSHLQKSHYDIAFSNLMIRNVANYSSAVLGLDEGELAEWEVLARFASLLGGGDSTAEGAMVVDQLLYDQVVQAALSAVERPAGIDADVIERTVSEYIGPERLLDVMLRSGPYGDWFGDRDGLTLAKLIENPHGIDLGALEPRLPAALLTPSGRPEFAHPDLIGDIPRLRVLLDASPEPSMQLINRRTLRSNNSWMHNLEILVKGKPRCTLFVHPKDAARIGLADGSTATVSSSAGSVALPVVIDNGIRPGVVSIPHGWGHSSPGTAQSVARRNPGVNVNVLTPSDVVDPLSGTSQLTGIPVTVRPG